MVSLTIGLESVRSFKRLPYTVWHALAEFIDNSTQSYANNRRIMDEEYERSGGHLTVTVEYSPLGTGTLTVSDNAMGMGWGELERALTVGRPPEDTSGRSRYGLGLKTAATWFGESWTVRTKRLGEDRGYQIEVNVETVASGNPDLPLTIFEAEISDHFTNIVIRDLNHTIGGTVRETTKLFLRSMYRQDLKNRELDLVFLGEHLKWEDPSDFATDPHGAPLRQNFSLRVVGKPVAGWAGVLQKGSRSRAGFSILHANRVVKGWPDAWRPREIFGQIQGSNNVVNQRVVGELYLGDFEVSHTKDDILWLGDEEEEVGVALSLELADLIDFAKRRRVRPKPGTLKTRAATAVGRLQSQLAMPELESRWIDRPTPSLEETKSAKNDLLESAGRGTPDFAASLDQLTVMGYLASNTSPQYQYFVSDATLPGQLAIVINMNHPHVRGMSDDALLDHLQHCAFEALAEWKVLQKGRTVEVDIITSLKDSLFRLVSDDEKSVNGFVKSR